MMKELKRLILFTKVNDSKFEGFRDSAFMIGRR